MSIPVVRGKAYPGYLLNFFYFVFLNTGKTLSTASLWFQSIVPQAGILNLDQIQVC